MAAVGGAGGTSSAGPVATSGPSVIGAAAAGKLLTGLSGTWAGLSSIAYRFQWYRCNGAGAKCLSVHGATSPSYSLGDRDVGQTVGLAVLAKDSSGTATAYSSLIGPIASRRPLLEATAQPVVAGAPVQGKTVQVTTGTWSPVPTNLTYRWERCNENGRTCAAIPNATGTSYTVTSADVGHALLAVVRAANGTTVQNAFSTATPEVVPALGQGPDRHDRAGRQWVLRGQPAARREPRDLDRRRPDNVLLPLVPLRRERRALRARSELHVEPVHDGREGRRHDDRGDGQGDATRSARRSPTQASLALSKRRTPSCRRPAPRPSPEPRASAGRSASDGDPGRPSRADTRRRGCAATPTGGSAARSPGPHARRTSPAPRTPDTPSSPRWSRRRAP